MILAAPPRRTAAALVLAAGALALTGCIPSPPPVPAGPGQSGGYRHTVDDEAGDTWSFSVTGLEERPPLVEGEPPAGTQLVAVLVDARHDDGSASFEICFDIFIEGSDGARHEWQEGALVAQRDLDDASEDRFSGARAVVALPAGVEPERIVVRSAYGHPEVPDTVVDVDDLP